MCSGSARTTSTRYSCTPPSCAVTAITTASLLPTEKSIVAPALSAGLPLAVIGPRDWTLPETTSEARAMVENLLCGAALSTNCVASKGTWAW